MSRRYRLLDLFCGAGGAAVGYARAGFEVVGVDAAPMPRFPFTFVQANALDVLADLDYVAEFDAVHASPPCQDHSAMGNFGLAKHGTDWLVAATRDLLRWTAVPWVIENVAGAPMRADYKVCGCMVGLPLIKRERWFETSWGGFGLRPPCHHPEKPIPIVGHGVPSSYRRKYGSVPIEKRRAAMGIDWMNRDELAEAIPPAYTEYIGRELLAAIEDQEAA